MDWDYYRNGNSNWIATLLGMVTIIGMVTVIGMMTVQGIVNIIAMVCVDNCTPYVNSDII